MKCVMCGTEIDENAEENKHYEIINGECWCMPCLDTESDTGEIY